MSLKKRISEIASQLTDYNGYGLIEYFEKIPDLPEIIDKLSYLVVLQNSYTNNHPTDDLVDVMLNPDDFEELVNNNIQDTRLEEFITPSIVAIIALLSKYSEYDYDTAIRYVLTDDACDYLAVYGRGLGVYGYDDAYDMLKIHS